MFPHLIDRNMHTASGLQRESSLSTKAAGQWILGDNEVQGEGKINFVRVDQHDWVNFSPSGVQQSQSGCVTDDETAIHADFTGY